MREVQLFEMNLFEQSNIVKQMYRLLHENMQMVLKEQIEFGVKGYDLWVYYNKVAIEKCKRKTVVVIDKGVLCGFFQYAFVDSEICSWDELQIDKSYRGDGRTILLLIREFFRDNEYKNIKTIRVRVNSNNAICLNLIKRCDFSLSEEVPRGAWYELDRASLEKKFVKYIN